MVEAPRVEEVDHLMVDLAARGVLVSLRDLPLEHRIRILSETWDALVLPALRTEAERVQSKFQHLPVPFPGRTG